MSLNDGCVSLLFEDSRFEFVDEPREVFLFHGCSYLEELYYTEIVMIWKAGISDLGLNREFLAKLRLAEKFAGFDFVVTSAFRQGDEKCHGYGKAVDLACIHSGERWRIDEAIRKAGFRRLGLYDKHVHVDGCSAMAQKVLWLGRST